MASRLTCGDVDQSYISRFYTLTILSSSLQYVREQISKLVDLWKPAEQVSDYPPGNQLPDRQTPIELRLDMKSKPQVETYGNSKSRSPELRISVVWIALRWRGWLRDARSQALHARAALAGSGSGSDVSATWHFSTLQVPSTNRNLKFSISEDYGVDENLGGALHAPCACCTYRSRSVIKRIELDPTSVSQPIRGRRATKGSRLALVYAVYAGRNVCKTGRSVVFDAVCTQWDIDPSSAPEGCAESSNCS